MTDTIKMTTIQGIRDALKIEERDYREIEGTGLAVARGGRVRIEDDFPEIDDFPWMTVIGENGIRRAHVPAAVALAWLTPEGPHHHPGRASRRGDGLGPCREGTCRALQCLRLGRRPCYRDP